MARRNLIVKGLVLCATLSLVFAKEIKGKDELKEKKNAKRDASYEEDDLLSSETRFDYYNQHPSQQHPFLSLLYPQQQPQPYPGNPYGGSAQGGGGYLPQQQGQNCGGYQGTCYKTRYRSYDGSCNNHQFPSWGQSNTKYVRMAPAIYSDGVHAPPVAASGNQLPLARLVSSSLHPDVDIQDPVWTLISMQWGQFMTHDMAMIDGTTQSKAHETMCCSEDGQFIPEALDSPLCFPIVIPPNDPVYSYEGQRCRNFVRSTTDLDKGCSTGYQPAEQISVVSAFLDLSLIYGTTDQIAAGLRARVGGRLITEVRGNREWLPSAANKSASCDIYGESDVCYASGDVRVNQNPQLTILHLIMHREHNRIAGELARLNPHWSDDTIFEEARRINTAIHQQISYYEWLPIFIGKENSIQRKILFETDGWVNDYDPNVDPSIINEFSNAAFRYFHSAIAGKLLLVDEGRFAHQYNALRFSDHLNRPGIIEENGNFDSLTRGMSFQPQYEVDQLLTKEITAYMFKAHHNLGDDLRSIDIQRNRDHGLASYNDMRELAGLPRAVQWSDFGDLLSQQNIQVLSQLYEVPDDVDLTVGAFLERHVEGTLAGPTFLNILSEQFWRSRAGDRYWYETGDPEIAFTIEQLAEIRKASISRLMCDNGDNIVYMQREGFKQVSAENPLLSCDQIPSIDLSYWRDIQTSNIWGPPSGWAKKK